MIKKEPKKFEDCIDIIDLAIRKQRKKWQLDAINWFDYDDVSQIIKVHIYNKWEQWDQTRPIEPWLSRVIYHQILNVIRNHYGNYTKPCSKCEFAVGEEGCSLTQSKKQDTQCVLFKKWIKGKKSGLDLKITVSTENHMHEISSRPDKEISYEGAIKRLNQKMREELGERHFRAYIMLFFEQATEEEVATYMGYKTSPEKRKSGYRQVKNLKKAFKEKAAKILEEEDIVIHDIN